MKRLPLLMAGTAMLCTAAAPPEGPLAMADRITWGPRGDLGAAAQFDANGVLAPPIDAPLPPAAAQTIAALRISQVRGDQLAWQMAERRRAINAITDPDAKMAADKEWQRDMGDLYREVQTRDILRALYSPAQMGEQLTWFWGNHFSLHAQKREIRALLGDWDDCLRAHALGKFRDLLAATVMQPAMLQYLDNDQNAAGHINENYAREIMELHTMGVGSGYTQRDVQELARVLTGVGVRLNPDMPRFAPDRGALYRRNGAFEFNPARHDFGDKVLLGQTIHGTGWNEVTRAIDILADQPATATHVSRKLGLYLLGHEPSPALVQAMTAEWRASDGTIARVVSVVLPPSTSDEKAAPPGGPLPVTQHFVPEAEWSSSDCASFAFGSTFTQVPA